MVKSYAKIFAGTLCCILGLWSCVDEDYDFENLNNDAKIELDLQLPVGRSSITIADLLEKIEVDGLVEKEGGKLVIEYDTTSRTEIKPFEIKLKGDRLDYNLNELDIFDLNGIPTLGKDLDYDNTSLPENMWPVLKAGMSFELPFEIDLTIVDDDYDARVDRINVDKATLKARFLNCDIPNFVESVDIDMVIPPYMRTPVYTWLNKEAVLNMDNAEIDLTGREEPKTIDFKLVITVTKDIKLKPAKNVNISLEIDETSITYKSIYGAVVANAPQEEICDIGLDLYGSNDIDWDLKIANPSIAINAKSNSGMPMEGLITYLASRSGDGKNIEVAEFKDAIPNTTYKLDFKNATNEEVIDAFNAVFDKNNGRLDALLNNNKPDSLFLRCSYRVNGNPNDNKSYYLLANTYIDMNIKAQIPLELGAKSYIKIQDTATGINIGGDMDNISISLADITLEIENGIPLDAEVNITFMHVDTTYKTSKRGSDAVEGVDYFVTREVLDMGGVNKKFELPAAIVGASDHKVVKRTSKALQIKMEGDVIKELEKLNTIIYDYKINTPTSAEAVYVTTDCNLTARAYARCKGSYNLSSESTDK